MTPITTALVRRLVVAQFPHWADLPLRRLRPGGWDNRSFRLGDGLVLRLPSGPDYAAQVAKEQRWLPVLAPQLPLPIPVPVAIGRPGCGYPFDWSVLGWIDGTSALREPPADPLRFALDLAAFLRALHRADTAGAPTPGLHNFHRGASPAVYDAETRACLALPLAAPQASAMRAVWDRATASRWDRAPVWLHGDVAPGNLLLRGGRLAAVIDFGCCAVGDPACDLAIRWMWFGGAAADSFRDAMAMDGATWDRARGWALWKTLLGLRGSRSARALRHHRRVMAAILAGP
jgi:aminoglycoside phosphotransferase (APT) family kinase protein